MKFRNYIAIAIFLTFFAFFKTTPTLAAGTFLCAWVENSCQATDLQCSPNYTADSSCITDQANCHGRHPCQRNPSIPCLNDQQQITSSDQICCNADNNDGINKTYVNPQDNNTYCGDNPQPGVPGGETPGQPDGGNTTQECILDGNTLPTDGSATCCSGIHRRGTDSFTQICGTEPGIPHVNIVDLNQTIKNMGINPKLTDLGGIITALIPLALGLAGFTFLIILIFGGFKYLTSAGDPKKTESAKGTITAAVVGFIIVITAYYLTQLVNFIFQLGTKI